MPNQEYALDSIITRFRPDIDSIERQHVNAIMSKVFIYCPEKLLTAIQLLQVPSFRALMDRYGC